MVQWIAASEKYTCPMWSGKATEIFGVLEAAIADRVVKGSRASKKSKTAALWFIYNMMKYPGSNLLVCRKELRALKDSCFTELKWAINRLGAAPAWETKISPLEMTYTRKGGTKQKIYFRGLDEPMKIASVTVESGALCWGWIEEATQIDDMADFDMLNESIRGEVPAGLWKMWTLTFNPWNERHWIKKRFFDEPPNPDIFTLTTNYTINEWLDDADRNMFEELKRNNPRRYCVAGLGEWGVVEGAIFDMFDQRNIYSDDSFSKTGMRYISIDYGTVNPMVFLDIWDMGDAVYVSREYYYDSRVTDKQKTDSEYAADLKAFIGDMSNNSHPMYIIIDPSAASFKAEIRKMGIRRKDADNSVLDGIRHLANLFEQKRVLIHESCVNTIKEMQSYRWDKKAAQNGKEQPVKEADHGVDALRYFCKTIINSRRWGYGKE